MEDIYKTELMLKWANKTVRNKASKMRRARMIRKIPENNSMIIKKHNHRKLHRMNVEQKVKDGFYKNPEFD